MCRIIKDVCKSRREELNHGKGDDGSKKYTQKEGKDDRENGHLII